MGQLENSQLITDDHPCLLGWVRSDYWLKKIQGEKKYF